jgi:hypothetical protein
MRGRVREAPRSGGQRRDKGCLSRSSVIGVSGISLRPHSRSRAVATKGCAGRARRLSSAVPRWRSELPCAARPCGLRAELVALAALVPLGQPLESVVEAREYTRRPQDTALLGASHARRALPAQPLYVLFCVLSSWWSWWLWASGQRSARWATRSVVHGKPAVPSAARTVHLSTASRPQRFAVGAPNLPSPRASSSLQSSRSTHWPVSSHSCSPNSCQT